MGRPPVPLSLKRDRRLVVMLTESENVAFSSAAALAGSASLSEWIRETLAKEADRALKHAGAPKE